MDMKKFRESDFVNAQMVKESPSKKLVILDEGIETKGFGDKGIASQFLVNIDGKAKSWKPNKESLEKLSEAYGDESKAYVGKVITLTIEKANNGQETVVGIPENIIINK